MMMMIVVARFKNIYKTQGTSFFVIVVFLFTSESPPPGYMSEDGDSQAIGTCCRFVLKLTFFYFVIDLLFIDYCRVQKTPCV